MAGSNRYKQLELAQLRSFSLAALQGNFTSAAKQQGLSVTTVWQQVRALERRLGTTLLQVHGRGLELTPQGRLLLQLIQPHVSGLDSLERLFQAQREELPQYLTVAATYYLLSFHLPGALREFSSDHPAIRLNLRGGIWPEVVRLLECGEADLGVVSYAADAKRSPHLDYEPLFDLHFMLLMPSDHPLARKRRVQVEDLVEYPLITSSKETFSYKTLERMLIRHGLADSIHVILESPNTDLLRKYVATGLGIALTYMGSEPEPAMPGLVQRVFDPKLEPLPVYLAVRKSAHLPPAVEAFRQVLRRHCRAGRLA